MTDDVGLAGSAHGQPDGDAVVAQVGQGVEHGVVVEDAALERGRMDLVEIEMGTEQRRGLGQLVAEHGQGVVLGLVDGGGHVPVPGVAVSPFRTRR